MITFNQRTTRTLTRSLFTACIAATFCPITFAEETTLIPIKDNTIIEDAPNLSNGMGLFFYAGRIGNNGGNTVRRGLIAFDLSTIPANAVVESATLELQLFNIGAGASDGIITLHKLLSDWGESDSLSTGGVGDGAEPGDATWDNTFHPDQLWNVPGGDFIKSASASQATPFSGSHTWGPTQQLTSDVQSWIDQPETNFGWLVLGDESGSRTTRAFASRQSNLQSAVPKLTVIYSAQTPGDCDDDADIDILDFEQSLDCTTGPDSTSTNPDCACANLDGDEDIDFADFAIFQRIFTGG